jgi:hypothetical protein
MKTENKPEHADPTATFYNRALEKTREGSKAADEFLHHHTYMLLAAGTLMGLVAGYLASQKKPLLLSLVNTLLIGSNLPN